MGIFQKQDQPSQETEPPGRTRNQARILVAGTAIPEIVVHQPGGESRRGLGGVAGQMALALAQEGNEVVLVTCVGEGPKGNELMELLEAAPFRAHTIRIRGEAGHGNIDTNRGEQGRTRGRWPRPSGLSRAVAELAGGQDCIAADCHMTPGELSRILGHPGVFKAVNGTTARSCLRIRLLRSCGLGLAGVNENEFHELLRESAADSHESLMRHIGADSLLTTRNSRGWEYRNGQGMVGSEAPPVPAHTDFVGCGDYATAGALHAHLHGLDPVETINSFIRRKLAANVVEPRG